MAAGKLQPKVVCMIQDLKKEVTTMQAQHLEAHGHATRG